MLRTMAEKKSSPKPIRLPADLVDKLEKLSLFLFEEGIHASHSLSATVVMVLRQGDKVVRGRVVATVSRRATHTVLTTRGEDC